MPDTPSITIVKSFSYRGVAEEWANTYHFSGDTPANAADWKTLADAIIAQEKTLQTSTTTFVKAYGYVAGNESSVWQINYADPPNTVVAGTLPGGGMPRAPGDAAFWVRWKTPDRNTKGRPIYLRKYFHGVMLDGGGDSIYAAQKTAATAYAAKMIDGTLPGNFRVCGPQGAVASAPKVTSFATTRTLKRRGSDPS